MIKIAINGFGRIGRTALRVYLQNQEIQKKLAIIAINTSPSMEIGDWAHLLEYDTAYGKTPYQVKTEDNHIIVKGHRIPFFFEKDPSRLPWSKLNIDLVIEATGVFREYDKAKLHLDTGAKKVLISAPPKGGDIGTYVLGVNQYKGKHKISDNASCTTNCVAPVAAVLHAQFGIKKAALTTVHAFTSDQNLQDGSHKDLRRARAASHNIIPTTTGAALATTKTLPELKGLFDGTALRVPTLTGSISDITALLNKKTTKDEVNQVFEKATQNPLYKDILATTDKPLVSSDIVGRPESAIVDLSLTQVIDGDLVKVFAWYDNEWGYCNRLLEQAIIVGKDEQ